jgi:regulatory protein SWI6
MASTKERGEYRFPSRFEYPQFTSCKNDRIPLERGRDIALQYGVAPLLAPLFDFTPSTNSLPSLPAATSGGVVSPRPLSASSSYGSVGAPAPYVPPMPTALAPPPIMPGSALRLLNQGRAQGLFTPSNSILGPSRTGGHASPVPRQHSELLQPTSTGVSSPPPTSHHSLKRNRSEADADMAYNPSPNHYMSSFRTQSALKGILDPAADIQISDQSRPSSAGPRLNGEEGPSPSKRLRKDLSPPQQIMWQLPSLSQSQTPSAVHPFAKSDTHMQSSAPQFSSNGVSKPFTFLSATGKDNQGQESLDIDVLATRFSTKPSPPSNLDPSSPSKDPRRAAILAAICNHDDSGSLFDLFRETVPIDGTVPIDVNIVLDDQGHTALHIAASMGRLQTVGALIASGADIHRGNFLGETPLMRACISTHNADLQIFHTLLPFLHQSIRTLDTARKSVLHHVVALAGVRGRAHAASYYLDQVFLWIAEHQGGDFVSLVDLQDENGDTALNIAARVGNRGLVRTLLDVGANRTLSNKLGLRPGDFGVETEV